MPESLAPPPEAPRSAWRRWGWGTLFTVLVLGWAAIALDWGLVWQALTAAHYGWVAGGVLLILLTALTRTWRWAALLTPHRLPFGTLFAALMMGQGLNYIAPARAGDVLRAYVVGQAGRFSPVQAVTTIAVEKLWDMAMLVLFTLTLALLMPLPAWLTTPARALGVTAVFAGLITAALLWQGQRAKTLLADWLRWLPETWSARVLGWFDHALKGLDSLRQPRQIFWAGVMSFLTWALGAGANYLIFRAFDLPLSLSAAVLLLVVLQVGVAVPSLPGRVGIFQGLCIVALAVFGVGEDVAFSYGVVLHGVVFLPALALAAWSSLYVKIDRRPPTADRR